MMKTPAGARLVAVALGVALSACTSTSVERPTITSPPSSSTTIADPTIPSSSAPSTIAADSDPTPPDIRSGDLEPSVVAALDAAWADYPNVGSEVFDVLADSGDARLAWLIIDYLTFNFTADAFADTRAAFQALTGVEVLVGADWVSAVDHLISWDVPAFPGYVDYKRTVFAAADERWAPFFSDDSDADYRFWTWGGVLIDDSPPRLSQSCQGCIPGLDDPRFTTADDGDWYPDDRPVLGVEINGEARAYPLNIMEVHEMVNDTLGGRDFTLPYCTLCRSAQLYFTDDVDGFDRPYMRTSGLLTRSNKIMYDVVTGSVFDTFKGVAITGPMFDGGVALEQGTVITTSWADWKAEFPNTTIVELELGAGRNYDLDPLGDRDAAGPIFPIGSVDDRLRAHDQVLGVVLDNGEAVAFPVDEAAAALEAGKTVALGGVEVSLLAGGLVASFEDAAIASHQAFWFAWAQFYPETLLWEPID